MKAPTPFLQKLADMNAQMRATSTCWCCGKPRMGFRRPVCGGRVVDGYDESGTEAQTITMAMPESYASAGLCVCERVEFYSVAQRRQMVDHPANGGLLVGFEPGPGGLASVMVEVDGKREIIVTAADFNQPVYGRIVAPDQPQHDTPFDLVVVDRAAEEAWLDEKRFAEAQ